MDEITLSPINFCTNPTIVSFDPSDYRENEYDTVDTIYYDII